MDNKIIEELKKSIRNVPDFPKKGILFKDITTLLKEGEKFRQSIELIADKYKTRGITKVVAIESRGFIFGGAIAYKLSAGFIPVRKRGKLPAGVHQVTYQLEYGTDTLQVHSDAVSAEDQVLIIDDLLATGGTAQAVCQLVEKLGAKIAGVEFLIELTDLQGRERLKGYPVGSILKF